MKYTTSLFCEFDKYAAESYCAVHDTAPELNIGDITVSYTHLTLPTNSRV